MEAALLIAILVLFALMVFLNVYFRIRILRHYRVLNRNRIQFDRSHIFNKEKLESEVITQHPEFADDIYGFSNYLKKTISMTTVLLVLITLFGAVLMYFR